MYTPSCKYWVLRLILYYSFSCNRIVIQFAIDVHTELQILSVSPETVLPLLLQPDSDSSCNRCTLQVTNTECFAWYCTTPSVATWRWHKLQSMYTLSCKYWVLRLIFVLPLQLQPNGGSSCNRCTLRVANTKLLRISPSEYFALYIFPFWRHSN
jgi:hypothetical protein